MSIYSGFATRSLEQYYDKMLYNLISTLLLRLTKFYKREPVEENAFLKIIFDQEKSLRKIQKRKYLDPKYSELLTTFKRQMEEGDIEPTDNKQYKQQRSRTKENHQLNRTLSLLGREFGELKANAQKFERMEQPQLQQNDSQPDLAKIVERKKNVSKRKKKEKKPSIRSNLDIWDMRQEKPPELPSLHPLNRTIMSKTKFNSISQSIQTSQKECIVKPYKTLSTKNSLSLQEMYCQSRQNSELKCSTSDRSASSLNLLQGKCYSDFSQQKFYG